jgi:Right handed beta helix region
MRKFLILFLMLIFIQGISSAEQIEVTGSTSADIQNALDNAESGDTITITEGDYYITKRIYQKDKSLTITGEGEVNLHLQTQDGSQNGLYFEGSEITEGRLQNDAKKGSSKVVLSDASMVKKGDLIKIWKNVKWCPLDYPDQMTGEMYKVESVSGNTVTLTESLLRDYPISDSSSYEIRRPIEIHIENINIYDTGEKSTREGLSLRYCIDSSVTNCYFEKSGIAALSFYSSYNVKASGNEIHDCVKPGSGYGIAFWSGTAFAVADNNKIYNCRHCITGNTDERISLVRGVTISNNHMEGGELTGANVVDAHNVVLDYVVTGNTIYPGGSYYAYADGCLDSTFSKNKVYGGYGAVAIRGSVDGGTHVIKDNYVEGKNCFLLRGSWEHHGGAVLIENNVQKGGRYGVAFFDGTDDRSSFDSIIIRDNEFSEINNEGIYVLCTQDDQCIEVSENTFDDVKKDDIYINANSRAGEAIVYGNTLSKTNSVHVVGLTVSESGSLWPDAKDGYKPEYVVPDKEPLGETYTVVSSGGHSDQDIINEALEKARDNPGSTVYLSAENGPFIVDGSSEIFSNTELTGDPDAVIQVWENSDKWFVYDEGIIKFKNQNNIKIYGFQIDGNCDELPSEYANHIKPGGSGHHNAEWGIKGSGSSNNFIENISIYNMQIYDTFSDGIRIAYADNVSVYDNFISNTQHENVYFICCRWSLIRGNELAGITSDCIRLDNCQNSIITKNYLFSYNGTNNNGATKGRHQGIQISDQGRSFNSGSDQPLHTENIEVSYNVFAGDKRMNFWIDSAGKGVENVFIHDNQIIDGEELETDGISVNGLDIRDVDYEHMPPKEMSEKVFDSIFDILDVEVTDSAYIEQGTLKPDIEWEEKGKYTKAWIDVSGYKGQIHIGNTTYIPKSPEECAIVLYGTENLADRPKGQTATQKIYSDDGVLKVDLTVKTKYEIIAYKKYTVLGKTVSIPYYKTKSETVTFTKSFYDVPETFPAFNPPKVYVTNYNGSHVIVHTPKLNGIVRVDTSYNQSECTERRLIGYIGTAENGFRSTDFEIIDSWSFSGKWMSRSSKGVYITEDVFDIETLNVTVVTPYDSFEITEFEYEIIEDDSRKIVNYALFAFIGCMLIYGRAIYKILYMTFARYM